MRVLIVEDEAKMAGLIRRGLEREGMAVDVAGDGEDALWRAKAVDYDAILLDLMLPGIDGLEVCRRSATVVGSSLGDRNEALDNLAALLLIGGPAALLLASLAGYWAAGSALRPVEAMRLRAAAISASGPEERLPAPAAKDELRRLARR